MWRFLSLESATLRQWQRRRDMLLSCNLLCYPIMNKGVIKWQVARVAQLWST